MKIGIASDHRGFELKNKLIKKYNFIDYGTNSKDKTDYPLFAFKLGEAVSKDEVQMGILICGSGIGMSIAANKVKGVRCAKVNNTKEAKYTRLDNDANIISLSSEMSFLKSKKIIDTFINTKFSNESRHIKRIDLIKEYEK